jgi:tripartite-type tricarboxylate transporter receptor subunit TctC
VWSQDADQFVDVFCFPRNVDGGLVKLRNLLVLLSIAVGAVSNALAQGAYPTKPIRWIIPYAPGGGTDVIARPLALKIGEVLSQPIVYENRPGGGGLIAGEMVAKATPDGYTLLVGAGNTHIFATLLYDKIPYDPVRDYAPITSFAEVPNILVARAGFAPKTPKDIIAFGKANPGKINWASSGNGAGGHLALVLFAQQTGINVVHVPYKGAGPATVAVLGGEADLLFANTGVFIGHIKAGKLRPIGAAAVKRIGVLPELPTFGEFGFPNLISGSFYGLLAPAGTPRPVINKLQAELAKIIHSPESVARLTSVGAFPVGSTPEQLAQYLKREVDTWGKIVREHGIKAS